MFPLLLPLAFSALAGTAFVVASKNKGPVAMTQADQVLYQSLLTDPKMHDPVLLRQYAKQFRDRKLTPQADMLDKRAALRELPQEMKETQRQIYRKAMASKNPIAVRSVADNFERMGATSASDALRQYADAIPPADAAPDAAPQPATPGELQ